MVVGKFKLLKSMCYVTVICLAYAVLRRASVSDEFPLFWSVKACIGYQVRIVALFSGF
jgi:hypothetical protein